MTTPPAPPPVRPREIAAWAMFDFANSGYTTLIVSVAFSVYFTKLVAPGERADCLWGVGIFVSNLVVMPLSPVVGAMADDTGRKKLFLAGTYLLCVIGTAALWWVLPGYVALGLTLFIVSNLGFSLGENLVASFLPEISTPATIGRISGFGWGLGYFGGLACLILNWPLLEGEFVAENVSNLRLVGPVTAAFFLVAALPTFLFLRERAPRSPARSIAEYARASFGRIAATARVLRRFSDLARFLRLFFLFSCGLTAVIAFASIYAERNLRFTLKELTILFIALQFASAGGAFLFGWIQDRIGARRSIQIALLLWLAVSVGAGFATTKALFWVVGFGAGLCIGSLQAASRALVGMFSPVGKSGEFFGFWGLAGKGGYMLGPLIFGAISSASGSQRLAIAVNALFFLAGLIGMTWIDERRGRAAAEAWAAAGVGGKDGEEEA